jgi:hypothetical protein
LVACCIAAAEQASVRETRKYSMLEEYTRTSNDVNKKLTDVYVTWVLKYYNSATLDLCSIKVIIL